MPEETATDGSSNTIVVGEDGQAPEQGFPADRRRDDGPTQDTAPQPDGAATPDAPLVPKDDGTADGETPPLIDDSADRPLDQELEITDIPLPARDTSPPEPEAEAEPGPKASPDVPPLPGEVPPGGGELVDLPPAGAAPADGAAAPPADEAAAPPDVPHPSGVAASTACRCVRAPHKCSTAMGSHSAPLHAARCSCLRQPPRG